MAISSSVLDTIRNQVRVYFTTTHNGAPLEKEVPIKRVRASRHLNNVTEIALDYWPGVVNTNAAPSAVPEGFDRQTMVSVAHALEMYHAKRVKVGDDDVESTTALAARFIREVLESGNGKS